MVYTAFTFRDGTQSCSLNSSVSSHWFGSISGCLMLTRRVTESCHVNAVYLVLLNLSCKLMVGMPKRRAQSFLYGRYKTGCYKLFCACMLMDICFKNTYMRQNMVISL